MSPSSPSYAFGSGDDAARRLLVLADVFEPAMAALLSTLPRRQWPLVVDLGCGPGSSTAHLARLLDIDQLVGLDSAASFIGLAEARVPAATFVLTDVTSGSWPVPPADLIYTRFLLAHLPDPFGWLSRWRARLAPGGVLLVEETERIETDVAAFGEYLSLVDGLVASRGGAALLGADLAAMSTNGASIDGATISRPFELDVTVADAATMFTLNLRSWRADPWIVAQRSPYEIDRLADELADLRDGVTVGGSIRWTLRQLAIAAGSLPI
jgi:trans-aconitate 2-methyltransferase